MKSLLQQHFVPFVSCGISIICQALNLHTRLALLVRIKFSLFHSCVTSRQRQTSMLSIKLPYGDEPDSFPETHNSQFTFAIHV